MKFEFSEVLLIVWATAVSVKVNNLYASIALSLAIWFGTALLERRRAHRRRVARPRSRLNK